MMYGLSLRVSWICLLLFSSGACFPATKGDYRYPYTWSSGGGSAPGSNLQSGGSRPPLVNLQYQPSVSYQQPQAAPQQASSSTGNQSPSSVGAPSASAASSPSYEPNWFTVMYDSSSNKPASAPEVPSQGVGYVSPNRLPPPTDTGKKTPSFSVQPQSAAATSGNINMGSGGAASGPVYAAAGNLQSGGSRPPLVNLQYQPSVSHQQPGAAPQQASSSTGNRSPSSVGAPSASAASSPSYGKKTPSFSVQPQSAAGTSGNVNMGSGGAASGPVYGAAPAYPAAGYMDFGDGPVPYIGAPAASSFAGFYAYGAPAASSSAGSYAYGAPVAYNSGGGDSSPGLPWSMQPAGGADSSFSDPSTWMPSRDFPDFSVWDSNAEMPQSMSETSPLPPSSYIIQSRNGYQRAQEFLSHTKYSPEYPEPPVFAAETEAPGMSPPEAGPKGGKKV
ncbi:uncharacterized protein LOC125880667 isoform X1 [Epinephelus fuscoguttatus]|uniref:uncharacterized protein LOC125880667 isoform X1 n=1 Tax=Epinephelus fuscoguttatus TaxID=293821 RepID=UPI0020D17CB1|nr:uncharacterized protein LOC125880667 isoform X1 [Epinephelus fuscoguttatus]